MNDGSFKIYPEPGLEFRYGQICEDPHAGLSLFGPYDADQSSRPGILSHACIGTTEGIALFRRFADAITDPVVSIEYDDPDQINKDRFLWPPFPGVSETFSTLWTPKPTWEGTIDSASLFEALKHRDPHHRAYILSNNYLEAIRIASQRDENIGFIVCIVPDAIWLKCRPKSVVTGDVGDRPRMREVIQRRTQPSLFNFYEPRQYEMSVDFRRQLKARSMEFGIPIQIIRDSTLRLTESELEFTQRGLTPLSDRAWNIITALYYKAGGKPWRLAVAREGVCYVGIGFRRSEMDVDKRIACCAAQMFLDTGDGVVFRGEFGPWYSPEDKEYHLNRSEARNLLEGVLKTYKEQGGKGLREIFLHSHSEISRDEYEGYCEACPDNVNIIGIRVRKDRDMRLFRKGKLPVIRGTSWKINQKTSYLWTSGFKAALLTYDGWEVPVPLRIDIQHGEADIDQVCQDIFGLTKLSFNACRIGKSLPVTIGFSQLVGEILVSNPTVEHRKPHFKFYI